MLTVKADIFKGFARYETHITTVKPGAKIQFVIDTSEEESKDKSTGTTDIANHGRRTSFLHCKAVCLRAPRKVLVFTLPHRLDN